MRSRGHTSWNEPWKPNPSPSSVTWTYRYGPPVPPEVRERLAQIGGALADRYGAPASA